MVRTRSTVGRKSSGKKTVGKGPRAKLIEREPSDHSVENRHGVRFRGLVAAETTDGQAGGSMAEAPSVPPFSSFKRKPRTGASYLSTSDLTRPVRNSSVAQTIEEASLMEEATKDAQDDALEEGVTVALSSAPKSATIPIHDDKGTNQSPISNTAENSRNSDLLESLLENIDPPHDGVVEKLLGKEKEVEKSVEVRDLKRIDEEIVTSVVEETVVESDIDRETEKNMSEEGEEEEAVTGAGAKNLSVREEEANLPKVNVEEMVQENVSTRVTESVATDVAENITMGEVPEALLSLKEKIPVEEEVSLVELLKEKKNKKRKSEVVKVAEASRKKKKESKAES